LFDGIDRQRAGAVMFRGPVLSNGYECLIDKYVEREVTAHDVVKACDVLMSAGFATDAARVLSRVLVPLSGTAAQYRYEDPDGD
jgi:hypothetical protein